MEYVFGESGQLLARWAHFMVGIVWIGILYYFNFIQGAFFAEADGNTKNVAISKLVPRALLWFRMGALYTWLTGVFLLAAKGHLGGFGIYTTPWGINILIGALLGTCMFLNVWLIIWPNQKIVIASANQVLSGGQPLPEAAACGARAGLASRTNTLFSIPLLLFMGMASHFSFNITATSLMPLWAAVFVIVGVLECNGIKGKLGPMATVRGVIHCGLALSAVLFVTIKVLT